MTTHPDDWRTGPDPMHCIGCGMTEARCDTRQTFASRHCCDDCEHEPKQATASSGTVTGTVGKSGAVTGSTSTSGEVA